MSNDNVVEIISSQLKESIKNCREYVKTNMTDENIYPSDFKNMILDLANILDKYKDKKECIKVLLTIEIILYHSSTNPTFGSDLMLATLRAAEEASFIFPKYLNMTNSFEKCKCDKECSTKNSNNELNLFNKDGSRCTIEELEKEI